MQGVTICEQVERKICADDNCVLVEGDPQVIDQMFLNFMAAELFGHEHYSIQIVKLLFHPMSVVVKLLS